MMTFLHFKVHNGQCKVSIGLVTLSPHTAGGGDHGGSGHKSGLMGLMGLMAMVVVGTLTRPVQ